MLRRKYNRSKLTASATMTIKTEDPHNFGSFVTPESCNPPPVVRHRRLKTAIYRTEMKMSLSQKRSPNIFTKSRSRSDIFKNRNISNTDLDGITTIDDIS